MAYVVDNRDAQEMYGYLEARVETLKRRIKRTGGGEQNTPHTGEGDHKFFRTLIQPITCT
jgi:hypothetical protein